MKRFFAVLAALTLLPFSPPALAQVDRREAPLTPAGNPSALIAAEIAFARLAREKGQWTAFAETAADSADMFVPQRTLAKTWLNKRTNPPHALTWTAQSAWASCDGSFGVTRGTWQKDGTTGWFSTVWERQRKHGDYKWVLDLGGDLAAPAPTSESGGDWIEGKVADCAPRPGRPEGPDGLIRSPEPIKKGELPLRPLAGPLPALSVPAGADSKDGQSRDGTLAWRSTVLPGGTTDFTVWMWKDGAMTQVLHESSSPSSSASKG